MARGANQTSFKRGNKAAKGNQNRKGAVAYDREELAAMQLDRAMVFRYINSNFLLTSCELKEKLRSAECSAFEEGVIQMILKIAQTGDYHRFEFLLDRTIGKTVQQAKIEVSDPYEKMTDEELTAELMRLRELNDFSLRRIEEEKKIQSAEVLPKG